MKIGDKIIYCQWLGQRRQYERGIIKRIGKTLTLDTFDGFNLADRAHPEQVRAYDPQTWYRLRDFEGLINEAEKGITELVLKQYEVWEAP